MNEENEFLPFARPSIGEDAIAEVVDCLRSGWITTGPRVERFEAALAEYFAAPHAICLSSATAGLHLALLALDLKPGDEVITSAMTFAATLNTIVHAGGTPVLVDVARGSYNLDMGAVEAALTPRSRAVMPVHFAGLSVDLAALQALADGNGLRVIEDAAHAIGAEFSGQRIGGFGDTQVFSFHPNKNMTTGEGGCVITRDDALAEAVRLYRFHGIDKNVMDSDGRKSGQHYDISAPGYKYNMMDLQAALGLHQLPALAGFNARRRELAERYLERLAGWPQLRLPDPGPENGLHAWHLFAPTLNPSRAGMSRDAFIAAMRDAGIGTGLHYTAPHLFSHYRNTYGFKPGDFPQAEEIGERVVSLPLFPDMTEADQDRVIGTMERLFADGPDG